jgi:membrane-associated phospholipid phosphatase
VVIAQAILAANALAVLTNYAVRRPRPFLYGDAAPLEARMGGNAALSFFSGHTTASFAATAAAFQTVRRLRPRGAAKWWVLAAGLAGSSFVGVSRLVSGNHFPTDVLAGAAVGTGVGFLLPALHDRDLVLVPGQASDGTPLLALAGRW